MVFLTAHPDLVHVTWILADTITESVKVDFYLSSGRLLQPLPLVEWWLVEGSVASFVAYGVVRWCKTVDGTADWVCLD